MSCDQLILDYSAYMHSTSFEKENHATHSSVKNSYQNKFDFRLTLQLFSKRLNSQTGFKTPRNKDDHSGGCRHKLNQIKLKFNVTWPRLCLG